MVPRTFKLWTGSLWNQINVLCYFSEFLWVKSRHLLTAFIILSKWSKVTCTLVSHHVTRQLFEVKCSDRLSLLLVKLVSSNHAGLMLTGLIFSLPLFAFKISLESGKQPTGMRHPPCNELLPLHLLPHWTALSSLGELRKTSLNSRHFWVRMGFSRFERIFI